MKMDEIQFIPRKTQSSASATEPDGSETSPSFWEEKLKNKPGNKQLLEDVFRFGLAIVVASGVYFLAVWFMADTMNYFLKHFIGLVLSVLFLAAFRAVQSTPPIIGKAVAIWLLLLFIYNISNHYFIPSSNQTETDVAKIVEKEHPADSVMALRPGSYCFKLDSGATTGWLKFASGEGVINYCISSSDSDYNYHFIIAGRKELYKGGQNASVPLGKQPFKIQALGEETITIVITRV